MLIHIVQGMSFTTLFCRNYYVAIPPDLIKAARIDGAGFFRIFWRIVLPLSPPILIVTVIWQFTGIWNEFLYGVTFTAGDAAAGHRGADRAQRHRDRGAAIRRAKRRGADRGGADVAGLSVWRPLFPARPHRGRREVGGDMAALSDSRRHQSGSAPLEVLKGIDLDIDSGEFTVLVGPSGCGKSTLLNIIAGLETAEFRDHRNRRPGGERGGAEGPRHRHGVPVLRALPLDDGAAEHHLRHGMPATCRNASRTRRVDRVARLLQIEPLLDRRPSQLSGGQRQRVAMGRALVRDPLLFLFDEPLSNLDAKLRVEMRMEIKQLHQRIGSTIVYVTHDQIEAMTMASRIAVINQGELQQFAEPDTVYNRPANLFVARFMGAPPMNTIPAVVQVANGGPAGRGRAWPA